MAKQVTTIPASIKPFSKTPLTTSRKRRVAAYARVSTDSDEQFTSYEAQVDYFTNYIKARNDWQFAGVYTDEGITGTNTKKREGFKRMVKDALDGKIDLIVTKSVSRFARNTVDSLTTIRKLKEHGTECFFEKENIWTFDSKGELLITIMSSLAQEESRSISENCTWGQRKRFADGKVTVPFKRFLGYDRGKDGNLVVNPKEAKIVKRIYAMYLQGKTYHLIAKALTEDGIPSPAGKPRWNPSNIKSILTNEKYKGDALLQKSFTTNFLTKEHKINEGEIPQYYVTGNHEAIIEPEVWELVQREIERRKNEKGRHSGVRLFSSKVYCGECGTRLGSKVWHSNDKYKQVIWQCNRHCKKNSPCKNGVHLTDEELKAAVLSATNKLIENKDEILNSFQEIVGGVYDTHTLEGEKAKLESEMDVCAKMIEGLIRQNAAIPQDQSEYQAKYEDLERFYNEKKAALAKVDGKFKKMQATKADIKFCLKQLQKQDRLLQTFDEQSFCALVDHITVFSKEDIRITFRNGSEICS